jgi:hypothetical protein
MKAKRNREIVLAMRTLWISALLPYAVMLGMMVLLRQ